MAPGAEVEREHRVSVWLSPAELQALDERRAEGESRSDAVRRWLREGR